MSRIILIDDDPEIRSMLEMALSLHAHVVITAADGKAGLDCSRTGGVDLIITDLMMPGMEGMETIRRFRKEFRDVPIIAMSGNAHFTNMLSAARHLGAVKTLSKPFELSEFLTLVNEVLSAPPDVSQSQAMATDV